MGSGKSCSSAEISEKLLEGRDTSEVFEATELPISVKRLSVCGS
jgi:hypothetical protein